MLLSYITWNVSPALFTIPGIDREVRWYAFAFVLGLFIIGPWILKKIWNNEKIPSEWMESLIYYVFFGMIIGARLGHCLFYDPLYYFAHPLEIIAFWNGGLASHGGTIGIIIAIWLYSRKVTHKSMLWTFDRLVVPVGFVAALIRLGNLMNSEVYGHPTSLPWGFIFVRGAEYPDSPCHPTQIYEAIPYVLVSFICLYLYWKCAAYKRQGLIFGVFLLGIFVTRFFVEYLKNVQEPFELQMLETMHINMGQALSIPFIIAGVWLVYRALTTKSTG
ncbi:MAG: prolipoprotein diacylglyceryl transferase [Dysgonamonadaceae bacterium]|jgi:prolipoprotein diacylglyceryl transferase|nr:prolipoprotein diacylglyceryl transferase [Dysgonamonadaceae bacterium]